MTLEGISRLVCCGCKEQQSQFVNQSSELKLRGFFLNNRKSSVPAVIPPLGPLADFIPYPYDTRTFIVPSVLPPSVRCAHPALRSVKLPVQKGDDASDVGELSASFSPPLKLA